MLVEEIISEINRYSSSTTSDAGVTTTTMPGGYKAVSTDMGTTTFNPQGKKVSYQTPKVMGMQQTVNYQGGPRISNIKNTQTTDMGDVDITTNTDGAGRMTRAGINVGDAKLGVDNKGNANMSLQLTDKDRMRASTQMPLAQRMQQLNKLKTIGSL